MLAQQFGYEQVTYLELCCTLIHLTLRRRRWEMKVHREHALLFSTDSNLKRHICDDLGIDRNALNMFIQALSLTPHLSHT